MDYQEGSILDPDAFKPRPRPMNNMFPERSGTIVHYTIVNKYKGEKKSKFKPQRAADPIRTGMSLFNTFQKQRSPEYKLKKTNTQIKRYEAEERLIKQRERLADIKEEYDKKHPSLFSRFRNRGQKEAVEKAEKRFPNKSYK